MKALRKPLSLFMAMLMCLGIFAGTGTTAFAAGETMTTYMVEFPRASDPNKAGWGHSAMNFLGGWSTGENNGFTIRKSMAMPTIRRSCCIPAQLRSIPSLPRFTASPPSSSL